MDSGENSAGQEDFAQLLKDKIENLRPKLLDLSRRNPLISAKMSRRSGSFVQIVDELPDVLAFNIAQKKSMRFVPLPSLDDDPKDEKTRAFGIALSEARRTDEAYLEQLKQLDPAVVDALDRGEKIERELKDRIRDQLEMPPRASKGEKSLITHAKNNDISPYYDLPLPTEKHGDGRHTDNDIQTLLLPDELERKFNGISTKCRTWIQESGINVLYAAFGFLEWKESNSDAVCFAPLVLLPVEVEKKRTREGNEFWVTGRGEEGETNLVLAEKLKNDFGIDLPTYEDGSIEDYLELVSDIPPTNLKFRIRRQVVFGVFPSSRMAMYHDLDTSNGAFEQSESLKAMLVGSEGASDAPFADDYEIDAPEIEQKVPNIIMDADSSQFSTLVDLAEGQNLAVEGPPGTGKSQTIVNAIACALAAGKKVLFVAEKMAALDVVKSRLEFVGLGEFVLPLQAERSTKERVIQSIRDRVEMEVKSNHRDLQRNLEIFKNSRAQLAEYVTVISQKFGNSELTVHEILAKNIATQGFLAEVPPDVQKVNFDGVEDMSLSQLQAVTDAAVSLRRSWEAIRNARGNWTGLNVANIDKFLVEDICDAAGAAEKIFRSTSILEHELDQLGIEKSQYDLDLPLLKSCLDCVEISASLPDVQLLGRLVDGTSIKKVEQFFSECVALSDLTNEIKDNVLNPIDPSWQDRLAEIERVCNSNSFQTLDLQELERHQGSDNALLEALRSLSNELRPFVEAFPECNGFLIGDLQCAAQLVEETSNTVLGLRSEITASPEAAITISKARELGEKLKKSADELGKRISLTAESEPQNLRKIALRITGSGSLRFLSSAFRSAKQTYMELSYSNQFDRVAAATDLRAMANWLEEKESFLKQPALIRVLGPHFLGLDTDFSAFGELLKFFEKVEQRLPGIENLAIRQILKHGDQNLLVSIPKLLASTWEGDYESLLHHIEELSERKDTFETEIEKLSVLLTDIQAADRIDLDGLRSLQSAIAKIHRVSSELAENEPVNELLRDRFKGSENVKSDVEPELSIAKAILPAVGQWEGLIIELIGRGDVETFRTTLGEFLCSSNEATALLHSLLDLTGQSEIHFCGNRTNLEIADFLVQSIENSAELYEHSAFANALISYAKVGHPDLVNICHDNSIDLSKIPAITEALVARSLAKRMYRDFGSVLGRFQGTLLDDLREKLAIADKQIIVSTRQMLRQRIKQSANPPPGRRMGKKSEWTEWALIENEINKRKRFVPVRDLTARSGKALQELKPCWMMSPLAVAQYIPRGTVEFDLCIIDEASQMPPEDAFGALVRSKQTMIVGDTNQLPPTSYFRRMIDEDDADEDENVLDESILELANAAFRPKRRLRWHYRSRHSGLINFSNRLVYDDDLIVFPSAHEDRRDMGVSLVLVDGVYKSGINGPEAQKMVDAALDFMEHNPLRSLGIVTLNQKQRDLLIEEMEFALRSRRKATDYIDYWDNKDDGLERFFIKNLESVQGDERDVIFIGTVYGPAQPGAPVMQRFGPINGLAGKRRLNVLFSRAKEQIVTFSSMTAADIRADENGNPGTYMLKSWLEYSATGVLDGGKLTFKEPDSEFEVFVIDQIKAMGCEAVPQVGVSGYFIDIGVKHPNWPHGFILAVECDGASYHSSKSARDRDRLRQEVLEGLGWHFHRIWSTDWFNDTHRETVRLRDAITRRLENLKKDADKYSQSLPEALSADVLETIEDDRSDEQLSNEPQADTEDLHGFGDGIGPGDTVHVWYMNDPNQVLKVTLSERKNDPMNGIVGTFEPLGEALLGSEEGDEIDVLIGSHLRRAVVGKVEQELEINGTRSPTLETNGTKPERTGRNDEQSRRSKSGAEAVKSGNQKFDADVRKNNTDRENPKLDPEAFYDPDYSFTLKNLSIGIINSSGPITHEHLCQKIARMHGFQRTGSQIRNTIWAAVHKEIQIQKGPSGENIFWPSHLAPKEVLEFRGLNFSGEDRAWKHVPYPEKLGLALEAIAAINREEPLSYMVNRLDLRRLTARTRTELEELLKIAERENEKDKSLSN